MLKRHTFIRLSITPAMTMMLTLKMVLTLVRFFLILRMRYGQDYTDEHFQQEHIGLDGAVKGRADPGIDEPLVELEHQVETEDDQAAAGQPIENLFVHLVVEKLLAEHGFKADHGKSHGHG